MSQPDSSSPLLRLAAAISPLALCLLLAWSVAGGPVGLGGGEKDLFLIAPLALWSLVFALSSLVMWAGGASLPRSTKISALVAVGVLASAFAALVVVSWR
jgi:hypothetical protein